MALQLGPEQLVSADDGPGLVRALARLADRRQFRLTPMASDSGTVHAIMEALRASHNERLLQAMHKLLSTIESRRGNTPNHGATSPFAQIVVLSKR